VHKDFESNAALPDMFKAPDIEHIQRQHMLYHLQFSEYLWVFLQ